MESVINFIKSFFEKSAFGVCADLGRKIGMSSTKIRLYFIYATLAAPGSTLLIYLILAFWKNVKRILVQGRNLIWS